jgi:hypothetical protein
VITSLTIRERGAASIEDDAHRLYHLAKLAATLLARRQGIISKALPTLDYLATSLACVDIGWHDSLLRGAIYARAEAQRWSDYSSG